MSSKKLDRMLALYVADSIGFLIPYDCSEHHCEVIHECALELGASPEHCWVWP